MHTQLIKNYSLFLFDFDGLLVNTEFLHFLAYKKMLAARGFVLNWGMATYASYALFSSQALQAALFKAFPTLRAPWDELYEEKRKIYLALLHNKGTTFMSGAERFLKELNRLGKKIAVVTHSPYEQISMIRAQLPLLQTITHWITREDYSLPKPHPEPYNTAIGRYKAEGDKIVGFEDSPRGLSSLLGTEADAVLVSSVLDAFTIASLRAKSPKPFVHLETFSSERYS